jgi:hypothetical protein
LCPSPVGLFSSVVSAYPSRKNIPFSLGLAFIVIYVYKKYVTASSSYLGVVYQRATGRLLPLPAALTNRNPSRKGTQMAIERHNTTILTPQTPSGEVLTSLVGRLRSHVQNIRNSAARQTVGKDMTAAADVIEHLLLDLSTREAAAAAMVALLGRQGYASYDGRRS